MMLMTSVSNGMDGVDDADYIERIPHFEGFSLESS